MEQIRKQGIQNTLVSYMGIGIGFLNAAILFPNFLTEEQLGLTRIFVQATMMLVQFSTIGLHFSIVRFFPFYRDEKLNHNKFIWLFLSIATIGIVSALTLAILGKPLIINLYSEKSPLFVDYFLWLIPLGIAYHYFNVFGAWAKANFKTVIPNFLQDILLRLIHTGTILLFYANILSFKQFMAAFIGAYGVILVLIIAILAAQGHMRLFPAKGDIRKKSLRFILKYSGFSMMSGITNTLTLTFDGFMIGAMIGLAEVGIYTTAVYFTSILMVSAKSFYRVTGPALANFWKDKEMKNIQKLYTNVTLVNTILGGLIFTLIWASITDIYTFMPDAFLAGKMVFLLYGIGRMVDLISGVNNTILVNSPKYKLSTYLNLLYTVLMVVLNLIFIPIWGMNGAAFATLISLSLFNILKAGSLYHYYRLHPFHKKFGISLVLVLLLFAIGNFLPSPFSPVVNIVFKSTVLGLVYLAMLYFTGLFNFLMKLGKKPK